MDWQVIRPNGLTLLTKIRNTFVGFYTVNLRYLKQYKFWFTAYWKVFQVIAGAESYKIDGIAKDHEWIVKNRSLLEQHLLDDMRDHGYIPIVDMSPGLTFEFDEEQEHFSFTIEAYGLKVGAKSHDYHGIYASQGIAISSDMKYVTLVDAL